MNWIDRTFLIGSNPILCIMGLFISYLGLLIFSPPAFMVSEWL
ncbi:hypothetical protein [Methanobrevibacter arboriphilus]|nr:hypothetical protein [Methanobrevibacter arboriphilus]